MFVWSVASLVLLAGLDAFTSKSRMELDLIKRAVVALSFGKRLPAATYVWDEAGDDLPDVLKRVCGELRRRLELGAEFNLIKFHTDQPKISFLLSGSRKLGQVEC